MKKIDKWCKECGIYIGKVWGNTQRCPSCSRIRNLRKQREYGHKLYKPPCKSYAPWTKEENQIIIDNYTPGCRKWVYKAIDLMPNRSFGCIYAHSKILKNQGLLTTPKRKETTQCQQK